MPSQARPTSGRAREALFAILQERIPGARVLDLYSGSGALGLEAVSRGAARAVLVERENGAIRRSLGLLSAGGREVELLAMEARHALAFLEERGERFEVILADPPYADGLPVEVASAAGRLLVEGGVLVLQHEPDAAVTPFDRALVHSGSRGYGRNAFDFFTRRRPAL